MRKTDSQEADVSSHKVQPIADSSDRDVYRSLAEVSSAEETRFLGLKRECGLHEMEFGTPA